MNPNRTQRISNVGKTTLFQEMKPHFKISHDKEAFIKTASAQSTTKHDRARSADQIALLEKTTIDDSRSGNRSLAIETGPGIDRLRLFVDHSSRRSDQTHRAIDVE